MESAFDLRQALAELGMSQTDLARTMVGLGDGRDEKTILRSIQRMAAGDVRVSGEMRAVLGMVSRPAVPFRFALEPDEVAAIMDARLVGGHETLIRRLRSELRGGDGAVTFTDQQLGELIRFMTRYGTTELHGRLRRAFSRSLSELLRLNAGAVERRGRVAAAAV